MFSSVLPGSLYTASKRWSRRNCCEPSGSAWQRRRQILPMHYRRWCAIVLAMEMRDPYTAGHQSRVAEIAIAIGKDMGWTGERLQALRMAAMVHDIGKISIPAELLTKPGNLNAAERAMINQHPETGYAILKDIPFMWPVAEMVHQHHEKLDGSGYPRGLKADEILPEAKVLAVADIVEAMAAYRPYRPGIELPLVLQQIEKDAGTLLDPRSFAPAWPFSGEAFYGAGLDTALISHFPITGRIESIIGLEIARRVTIVQEYVRVG